MNDSRYTIRNYRPTDFNGYVQLNVQAEKLEATERCTSSEVLRANLGHPNYSPEQDMFVVETDRRIVGFMNVIPERRARRVILDCLVHPAHRRQGLATRVLSCALQRAEELKVEFIHVNIREDNAIANSVLPRLDFMVVRKFLELRLQLSEVQLPEASQGAYVCRHLQSSEEDKLAQIQNRCFAGTWGYNTNTTEDVVYRLNSSRCSPDDVVLICDKGKPVAYCWTIIYHETEASGEKKGRIYMIGVDPDFRGKGLGRAALLAGLSHLKTKGIEVVDLTVDSENKTAYTLYQSLGFKVWTSSLWYEKAIS